MSSTRKLKSFGFLVLVFQKKNYKTSCKLEEKMGPDLPDIFIGNFNYTATTHAVIPSVQTIHNWAHARSGVKQLVTITSCETDILIDVEVFYFYCSTETIRC